MIKQEIRDLKHKYGEIGVTMVNELETSKYEKYLGQAPASSGFSTSSRVG